eukprot:1160195-Pelagomonas_calceolata.AAC.3
MPVWPKLIDFGISYLIIEPQYLGNLKLYLPAVPPTIAIEIRDSFLIMTVTRKPEPVPSDEDVVQKKGEEANAQQDSADLNNRARLHSGASTQSLLVGACCGCCGRTGGLFLIHTQGIRSDPRTMGVCIYNHLKCSCAMHGVRGCSAV